ncbi:MAG: hypothetical protein F9K22_02500 [Bacteroidetes bacterium]|nr:MAG: hypothetical protein F9K22_02500 [Bacteroidota bacterium]
MITNLSRNAAIVFLSVGVVFAVAAPYVLNYHFAADDYTLIRTASTYPFPLFRDFNNSDNGFYLRPLFILSLAMNYFLAGWEPRSYFAINIILHAINSVLAAILMSQWTSIHERRHKIILGLLFFLLPQGLLNVYWISGRTDLLCFTGIVSSILLADRYAKLHDIRLLVASGIAFIFALLSKETALLIWIYAAIAYTLGQYKIDTLSYRKNYRPYHLLIASITFAYFCYRKAVFGVFIGEQAMNGTMGIGYVFSWFIAGLWSVFIPLDPVEYRIQYNIASIAFVLITAILFVASCMFIFIVRRGTSIQKRLCALFFMASIIALGIYYKAFPQGRLAYIILPIAIPMVIIVVKKKWSENGFVRLIICLVVIISLASTAQVMKTYYIIGKLNRSAEEIDINALGNADTVYVAVNIGRIGQKYVESSKSVLHSLQRQADEEHVSMPSIITLSTVEGGSVACWDEPIRSQLLSDTIILDAESPNIWFVPSTSRKYLKEINELSEGLHQQVITTSEHRTGAAKKIKVYRIYDKTAPLVFLEAGRFRVIPQLMMNVHMVN